MKVSLLVSLLWSTRLLSFVQSQPPTAWICPTSFFDSRDGCDCECGAFDPDCLDPTQLVFRCARGTCNAEGHCIPDEWECPNSFFHSQDGCHCECGAFDPDCLDPAQPLFGCDDGICNTEGNCVPAAWFCSDSFYDSQDGCDCKCGAFDPDCLDPIATVLNCDNGVCDAEGNCQTTGSRGLSVVAIVAIVIGSVLGVLCVSSYLKGTLQPREAEVIQPREGNVPNNTQQMLVASTHSEEDLTPMATILAAHEIGSNDNIPQATIDSPFGDLGRHQINNISSPMATILAAHEIGSNDNIPQATIDSPFGDHGRHNVNHSL